MVSHAKRIRYDSEMYSSSSDYEDSSEYQQTKKNTNQTKSTKNHSLSRNALMARENRLRKKRYITNLETENKQLKRDNDNFVKILDNQSVVIKDLKKEVQYLKSVIANSGDICKLIRNINQNTGMSVRTSLEQNLSKPYISKPKSTIARKTAHPWEDTQYPDLPTPESIPFSSPQSECGLNDEQNNADLLFDDLQLDTPLLNDMIDPFVLENTDDLVDDDNRLKEHDYTSHDIEDVGVCLHIRNHRVSLEFCSTCSENAINAWKD